MVAFVKISTQFHEHFETDFYTPLLYTQQEGWQREAGMLHWKDKPVISVSEWRITSLTVWGGLFLSTTQCSYSTGFLNPPKIAATICCYEMKTLHNFQLHVPVTLICCCQGIFPYITQMHHLSQKNTFLTLSCCYINLFAAPGSSLEGKNN